MVCNNLLAVLNTSVRLLVATGQFINCHARVNPTLKSLVNSVGILLLIDCSCIIRMIPQYVILLTAKYNK